MPGLLHTTSALCDNSLSWFHFSFSHYCKCRRHACYPLKGIWLDFRGNGASVTEANSDNGRSVYVWRGHAGNYQCPPYTWDKEWDKNLINQGLESGTVVAILKFETLVFSMPNQHLLQQEWQCLQPSYHLPFTHMYSCKEYVSEFVFQASPKPFPLNIFFPLNSVRHSLRSWKINNGTFV